MIVKPQTGLLPIQKNVPNVMSQLRRMEAVTIWYAKTKTARLTSVGCAWDPGSLMGPHGTIVTDMMRMRLKRLETTKRNLDQHFNDIYSTATDT